jgi:hypothetical protein
MFESETDHRVFQYKTYGKKFDFCEMTQMM